MLVGVHPTILWFFWNRTIGFATLGYIIPGNQADLPQKNVEEKKNSGPYDVITKKKKEEGDHDLRSFWKLKVFDGFVFPKDEWMKWCHLHSDNWKVVFGATSCIKLFFGTSFKRCFGVSSLASPWRHDFYTSWKYDKTRLQHHLIGAI